MYITGWTWKHYDSDQLCPKMSLDTKVIHKVPQRGTKLWFWSFFEKTFCYGLVSSSYIRDYFEHWVKFLGPRFSSSQTLKELS